LFGIAAADIQAAMNCNRLTIAYMYADDIVVEQVICKWRPSTQSFSGPKKENISKSGKTKQQKWF
jgi:hypothetical protein